MEVRAVLVAIDHSSGRAGVVIDGEGDVWLTDDVEDGGGTRLDDHRPVVVGLNGNRTVFGGRLPPDAVSVEVVTEGGNRVAGEAGHGAWVVVLDEGITGRLNPVLRLNRDGAPVPPPLPDDWAREPLTDSEEPCPACDAVAWDVVTPTDRSRGWGASGPTQVVVCRVCGHEESIGAVIRLGQAEPQAPAVVSARIRADEETRRLRQQMMLRSVEFPIYGIEGLPAQIGGSGTTGDDVTSVTITHGEHRGGHRPSVSVTTEREESRQPDDRTLARSALARALNAGLGDWAGGSDAAFVLKLRANERARRRVASNAPVSVREISVDGEPCQFTCVGVAPHWAGVGHRGSLRITVMVSDAEPGPIRLTSVTDPAENLT